MNSKTTVSPGNIDTFLHSKLMPPRLHADVIRREALLERLDQGLLGKLILVEAPTGFGKTTLVSTWIASRKFRSAWVTLDENDNDPSRFWSYVISAIRTLDESLGRDSLSMLMSAQPPSAHALLTPLVNDLERLQEPGVLVLEDYQSISSPEIHTGAAFLLQHLPERLHLVILTRGDPDLPLSILRARGELVEIHAGQLRFDREEAHTFLQAATKTELPASSLEQVLQKTEGWPAGLRLLAVSLQNAASPAEVEKIAGSFSGSSRHVADYLIQEVFESQAEKTRSFLLQTCFLSRLTGGLCDAVMEPAPAGEASPGAQALERLERDGLFIEQLEQSRDKTWYRYNPLFAESLQHLAKQRLSQAKIEALFERASSWYARQGLFNEAIEAALDARSFEGAMGLIERYIEIHDLSGMYTLGRWLEQIPGHEILRHPMICFTYAQVLLYSGDRFAPATAARIVPYLAAAEKTWEVEGEDVRLGQLNSFRGIMAWWQGDLRKAFAYAQRSLEALPESDVFWRGTSLLIMCQEALDAGQILQAQDLILEARALLGAAQNIYGQLAATQMLGEAFYRQGELEQAEQLNRQILEEAVGDESMQDDQGIASLNLAHIAYERDDLDQAGQLAQRASELAARRANEFLQVQAGIRLAQIHSARMEREQAVELLKALESGIRSPALLRDLHDAQALLAVRANGASALEWWSKLPSSGDDMPVRMERQAFVRARLLLAEGKPLEALREIEPWKAHARQHGRVCSHMEALCLEALAKQQAADLPAASEALGEALRLGQAHGFRRTFLDEGSPMAALLKATQASLPERALNLYITALLHAMAPGTGSPAPLVEALSGQEARVLRLLSAGLSNAEIARELVVSTNTVKTQVKSIYRKLNVSSRQEATQLARQLKLL